MRWRVWLILGVLFGLLTLFFVFLSQRTTTTKRKQIIEAGILATTKTRTSGQQGKAPSGVFPSTTNQSQPRKATTVITSGLANPMMGTIQNIWLKLSMNANTTAVLANAATNAIANVGLRPIRCDTAPNPNIPKNAPMLIIIEVSPPQRWLLHRRIAQGLELLHADDPDAVSAQLAEQYARGGRGERAVTYYSRAAEIADSMFAHAEAIRLCGPTATLLEWDDRIPSFDEVHQEALKAVRRAARRGENGHG
jgi:hypothetical protein